MQDFGTIYHLCEGFSCSQCTVSQLVDHTGCGQVTISYFVGPESQPDFQSLYIPNYFSCLQVLEHAWIFGKHSHLCAGGSGNLPTSILRCGGF